MKFLRSPKTLLGWIAVFPAAAVAAWFAWVAISYMGWEAFSMVGIDPELSTLARFAVEGLAHFAMGAAAIYAGATTAPRQTSLIALLLLGLTVLAASVLLLDSVSAGRGLATFAIGAGIAGAVAAAWKCSEMQS